MVMSVEGLMVDASNQHGDMVTIRIRADETVRAVLPPIIQGNLAIEADQSKEANDLAKLMQMIKELLRQVYYGGVIIDTRSQPPSVTSDLQIPANMVFVIGKDGKTTQYKNDKFSLDVLKLALKLT
jgi:hypothetical protein